MHRIALYSPGMVGLGHMRRSLLIAQAIAGSSIPATTLLISEARQAGQFTIPPGVDLLTLPALRKLEGQCEPRYLDVALDDLVAMRAQAILGILSSFNPDILIVDHLPWGAVRELTPTLTTLKRRGHTQFVLGLRDILDSPEVVRHEWHQASNESAIRSYYDSIWVYGDRSLYDPVREYHFAPDIASKVRFAGYLDAQERRATPQQASGVLAELGVGDQRLALCLVGGGQDGVPVAEAFAQATLPPDTVGVIVTGPFMPQAARQRLDQIAAQSQALRVIDFVAEPTALLQRADCVVAMGGYNTVCEILAFEKPSLIVPRGEPRYEQRMRAERLEQRGLLDMLLPEHLTPEAITQWLAHPRRAISSARHLLDLGGMQRIPHLLQEMLEPHLRAAQVGGRVLGRPSIKAAALALPYAS